ncbi:SigE family RNA polymerase sigma factor [Cellulomonas oligotrophica]|uniref:RNA polymerase sigma factor n=1 Tax=Cellulomonas oligotrophica TaxID=931536 RepID=A0ABQ4D9T3_9CELL|nr:RNA polymerase sigma factor [Cellulomonas oligotrophica]
MPRPWEPVLDALVRERYPRLIARAVLVTATHADAEDLVQDALVATFASRARFTHVAAAEQYVRRVIVTRSVDRARTAQAERRALARTSARPVPTGEVELQGLERDVVAALRDLPPRQRACVVLRHLDDVSVTETARLLGLSEGAVKRYTAEGSARLQQRLGATTAVVDQHVRVELVGTEEARRD